MILLAPLFSAGQAISYHALGGGVSIGGSVVAVRGIYFDSLSKKLYAGGHFKFAEGKIAWGIAVYNGTMWDTLAGGITQYPHNIGGPTSSADYVRKIIVYQGKVYISGGFFWVNGKAQYQYGIFNGTTWEYPIPEMPNGYVLDFKLHNGKLYACGLFTKFGNTTCNYVAQYDGSSWQPVGDLKKYFKSSTPAQINSIEFYNGELYVGGAFSDSTGTPRNFAKFDGTKWVNVGQGIQQGGVTWIATMKAHKGELYIGGRFAKSTEIPSQMLVKWNSQNFIGVPHDLNGNSQVQNLASNGKKLFVQGVLQDNGDTTNYNVFFVDSASSCIINELKALEYPYKASITCIDVYRDSLFVAGDFDSLGTVDANSVAAITNYELNVNCDYVGMRESNFSQYLKIYPNPANDKLTIEIESITTNKINLSISNSLGQVIFSMNGISQKQEINLSSFPKGIYFLRLQNSETQKVVKVIKN